jgi:hypothetical protein
MRKKAKFHAVGKEDTIVLKKEFDSEDEARQYIEQEFNDSFIFGFEFSRVGWQYSMGEYRLFVEDIEKMPPVIEIEAGTEEVDIHHPKEGARHHESTHHTGRNACTRNTGSGSRFQERVKQPQDLCARWQVPRQPEQQSL